MIRRRVLACLAASVLGCAAPAAAQLPEAPDARRQAIPISTAVSPDTVTVGDPFTSVVRVQAPAGSSVAFHGLAPGDPVQAIDTVRVIATASDSGATAAYRLVAWVAGTPFTAAPLVRVTYPNGDVVDYEVPLAVPVVASVLPAGGGDLAPRPSRGVIPLPPADRWPWTVAAAIAALLLAGWLFVARRMATRAGAPRRDAREAALAALDSLRSPEHGADPANSFAGAAAILRGYLAEVDPALGREWTSSELVARLRATGAGDADAESLAVLLAGADRVKFAGIAPAAPDAASFLRSVRAWITSYPPADEGRAAAREAA